MEDLHWIDRISQELLDYLIGWLANTHIMLIVLYRPEYTHQWGSKSYYNRIGLSHLSAESSAKLVQAILEGGEVAPELRDLILARAGGNPLFVEEFTHTLLENGVIQRKDQQYVLTRKLSEIEVPDTIQGVIAARIDRVEENLKRIMQTASVIGREFAFRILQTIMGMREELKSHLLNLQGLEFISEKRLFPELEYIFKHALIQEVAYNSLLQQRRKEIHEKIGEAIESLYPDRLEEYYELIAYHYQRSDNKDRAVAYLALANQKAIKLNALEEAKLYFDDAMKLLDTVPETRANQRRRVSLLTRPYLMFQLLYKLPEYHELLSRYEPMVIELNDVSLLGAFYARRARCEWASGDMEQAIQNSAKAIELCEAAGNAEDAGDAYLVIQWSYLFKGDYDKVIASKEDVLRKMGQQFNLRTYVWAIHAAIWAYDNLGLWDQAEEEGNEAMSVSEEYSDDSLISLSAWLIAMAWTHKGDLERAIQYGELAVEKAPTPADKAWSQGFLAWAWCRAGEPKKGIEILGPALPIHRAVRFRPAEIAFTVFLGEGYWLAGEYDKAKQVLEELLELAERCDYKYYAGWAQRLLGEIALKTKPEEAAPHFERSIAVHREIKAENELALTYAGYGRLHKQQGKIERAREYLTRALEIFERLSTLTEPEKVKKELAELPEG
jgi:predicted ATPase